jgi:glycosyltransferase involved in cell wall biosynthesis
VVSRTERPGDVAIAHDALVQRGGAERVVLTFAKAFPNCPIYTCLYEPDKTYEEFRTLDVRPLWPQRVSVLQRNHRAGLPLYYWAFSRLKLTNPALICSTAGLSHYARTSGVKIMYCYAPARWLYQTEEYLRFSPASWRLGLRLSQQFLKKLDYKAAWSADRIVTSCASVRDRIEDVWGRRAEIIPPPPGLEVSGVSAPIPGLEPGFLLVVARLLPYKNVQPVLEAAQLLGRTLVVVGSGPDLERLQGVANRIGADARFVTTVTDPELRWLYQSCACLVAASYEDFGLTPLEANGFGKPVAALGQGGFLETVVPDVTGVLFDRPEALLIAAAVKKVLSKSWNRDRIREWYSEFGEDRFVSQIRRLVRDSIRQVR